MARQMSKIFFFDFGSPLWIIVDVWKTAEKFIFVPFIYEKLRVTHF